MKRISIKSEMDSRMLLYPLMRCVSQLGTVLLITSNKLVSRLIEGEYDGDFRNIRILVDTDGATDELLQSSGVSESSFDFIIYDNVGVLEQDILYIPIGPIVSESFEEEMLILGEDKGTTILRFGREIKSKKSSVKPVKKTKEELEAEYDPTEKFKPKKKDVKNEVKKLRNIQFPKYDDIEELESNKKYYQLDENLVKIIYDSLKDIINLKYVDFKRGVSGRDEISSSIRSRESKWENSVSNSIK